MIGILGKKLGMTNIYTENGKNVSVTLVEAGPCQVTAIRTTDSNGYNAIQLGFGPKREKLVNRPDMGNFKKSGTSPVRYIREIRMKDVSAYKPGQTVKSDIFAKGDYVDVTGISIGRGFQGGVKRWGWAGGDAGHGSMFHRRIGSIQSGARLNRITKGHHMPGHMGVDKTTVQNLEVMDVIADKNLILVRGCVPGHKNCLLMVRDAVKRPKGFVKKKVVQATTKKSVKAALKKKVK